MNRAAAIIAALLLAGFTPVGRAFSGTTSSAAQSPLRIAVIGFTHSQNELSRSLESVLGDSLSRDPRVALIDQSLIRPALAGVGYDGSINMSKDEARKLGSAIGCDFFLLGKAEALTRSEHDNKSYEEAYAGVLIVDGRTGTLAAFDFILNNASTTQAARQSLSKSLGGRTTGYVDRMTSIRTQTVAGRSGEAMGSRSTALDPVEEMPVDGSQRAEGFKDPEFLNRVKPEYAIEADKADITATVEAMVVLRSNGDVGAIEITRWAGFGLDESAERAIRQLKFNPATRDGNPINLRALIRYNFRRVSEPAGKFDQPVSAPPEKPVRDLRELFKPTYRRPPQGSPE